MNYLIDIYTDILNIKDLKLNLPTDSEDQQGNLDCVELIDNWIELRVFDVQNLLININQVVHLSN
jgi:hypothetical protein